MTLPLPVGPLTEALGWALLHLVWQGALVGLCLFILLLAMPRRSANARYVVSCGALFAIVALGVVSGIRSYEPRATGASVVASWFMTPPSAVSTVPTEVTGRNDRQAALSHAASDALPTIVTVWLLGVAIFSLRLLADWARARRLLQRDAIPAREPWPSIARRLSAALGVRRIVRVFESARVEVPCVIGLLRPAILIPASTVSGLTVAQFEMILAHELAHVRRHDFIVNLMQAVIETLLFYHPAVWWISRQIRIERENCCDDLAVALSGQPVEYARALLRLEELRGVRFALSANSGSLFSRIRRLVTASPRSQRPVVRGTVALVALSCLLAVAVPSFSKIGHSWGEREQPTAHQAESQTTNPVPDPAADPTSPLDAGDSPSTDDDPMFSAESNIKGDAESSAEDDAESSAEGDAYSSAEGDEESSAEDEPEADEERRLAAEDDEKPTLDELIALRTLNVDSDYIREMRSLGVKIESAEEAQGLRAMSVTPDYVREMVEAGLEVGEPGELQSLRAMGVTPRFVRRLAKAGYSDLSVQDLNRLAAAGVTGSFIREMSRYRVR